MNDTVNSIACSRLLRSVRSVRPVSFGYSAIQQAYSSCAPIYSSVEKKSTLVLFHCLCVFVFSLILCQFPNFRWNSHLKGCFCVTHRNPDRTRATSFIISYIFFYFHAVPTLPTLIFPSPVFFSVWVTSVLRTGVHSWSDRYREQRVMSGWPRAGWHLSVCACLFVINFFRNVTHNSHNSRGHIFFHTSAFTVKISARGSKVSAALKAYLIHDHQ